MQVTVKVVSSMNHPAEEGTIAFTSEYGEMPIWEAHRMVRRHIAELEDSGWYDVTQYNTSFIAEHCKVYKVAITFRGIESRNRDVFYIWALEPDNPIVCD